MTAEHLVTWLREQGARVHRYQATQVYCITSSPDLVIQLGELGARAREYQRVDDDPSTTEWDISLLGIKVDGVDPELAARSLWMAAAPVIQV